MTRRAVQQEASLLRKMTGDGDLELMEMLSSVALIKDWNEGHARIVVCCLTDADVQNSASDNGNAQVYWVASIN